MAGLMSYPAALGRLRTLPLDVLRTMKHRELGTGEVAAADQLLMSLDAAAAAGRRLNDFVSLSEDSQPLANAASICRWELLRLRGGILDPELHGRFRSLRAEVIRHLEGAASAAQMMSGGYRFHNLDRICNGGESLDSHLAALDSIRRKLASQV